MSVQTGEKSVAAPPPTSRGVDRMRTQVKHWKTAPNPVWIRELRQSARLLRTPYILLALTVLSALFLCSIGGLMAGKSNPADIGEVLYQIFFSIGFFVVTWAGPALAANSIASEREGRTWEALLLTGLPPGVIARGKFLAAFTGIGMYIVMLAPVGALAFVFGGVTATEVFLAFVWLFIIAGLSVAFGLALSSKMQNLRGALLLAVMLSVVISLFLYLFGGLMMSALIHDMWKSMPKVSPVWLPKAYLRASFDLQYLTFLVFLPLIVMVMPAWFLYEVTIANLTSVTDDRSSGVRLWFIVASIFTALGGVSIVLGNPSHSSSGTLRGLVILAFVLYLFHVTFGAFVFAGEPIGPSRRVKINWKRHEVGMWKRSLGPGVISAAKTQINLLVLGTLILTLPIIAHMFITKMLNWENGMAVGVLMLYLISFGVFMVGCTSWLRVRTNSSGVSRVLLLVIVFFAMSGPWILAAISGGLATGRSNGLLVIAAPSPGFALLVIEELNRSSAELTKIYIVASVVCSAAWALFGIGMYGVAKSKCNKIIRDHETAIAKSEEILAKEDESNLNDEQPGLSPQAPNPVA
jgi:ABC-type transport system involved in multi-copper enzyme maturation permease subunit